MDGNRRYAKKLSTIFSLGHKKWGENIETVLGYCLDAGISYVSMWALSKENITERAEDEISAIYEIIRSELPRLIPKLQRNSIAVEIIGDIWLLPLDIRNILFEAVDATKNGKKMTCILALGYGGQDEIVRGVKRAIAEWVDPASLTEKEFLTYLDTGAYPPPDIIVRTGGNIRHSGFFLYQSAYSEYYFTDVLWPEFDEKEFQKVLTYYEGIQRNFGK